MTPSVLPMAALIEPAADPPARLKTALVSTIITHPTLNIAHDLAMDYLTSPADHPFVMVVGPSGVGKTALLATIDNRLHYESASAMLADPSLRPAIRVDAPASTRGRFDYVALWNRIIVAAEGPADRLTGDSVILLGVRPAISGYRGDRPADMKRAAIRACQNRGVAYILVDEANHLSVMAAGARAADELEVLKDFAMAAGVRILLVGAADVLAFRDLSAQVGRRVRTVPFLAYGDATVGERREFRKVAKSMLEHIDGAALELDEELRQLLFDGSVGCVGMLRNWLVQAEHHHARAQEDLGFRAALEASTYPAPVLRQALEENDQLTARLMADGATGSIPRRRAPHSPPTTSSGQQLKPGERRPVRQDFAEVRVG